MNFYWVGLYNVDYNIDVRNNSLATFGLNSKKLILKRGEKNENNAKKQLHRYLIHALFEDQSMLASTVIPQSLSMTHAPFEDDVNTSFGRYTFFQSSC